MNLVPDLERGRRFVMSVYAQPPLLVGVTGAHAYGFPSPDSDLDLKGIHVLPTEAFLGLEQTNPTLDRITPFEGQEMDCTTHELGAALRLLLKGNGNMLERILTPYQLFTSPEQAQLVEITQRSMAKNFFFHYRGFFANKRKEFEKAEAPTAKGLLYVYRSALTGIHLLSTGKCEMDVRVLARVHAFPGVEQLVEIKQRGTEFCNLTGGGDWSSDLDRLEALLTAAHSSSNLPEEPTTRGELDRYVLQLRLNRLGR
jgi:predicted nucleotidyltransferase